MRKTGLGEKYLFMCHNQHKCTQTEQELSRDICVERLARNRMSLVMYIHSLNSLPSRNLRIQKEKVLLLVVHFTNGLPGTNVIGLEPVTGSFLLRLLMYSLP
jgi:hypothetical protein